MRIVRLGVLFRKCCNKIFHTLEVVKSHLFVPGIQTSYVQWVYHGEEYGQSSDSNEAQAAKTSTIEDEDDLDDMLHDAFGPIDEHDTQVQNDLNVEHGTYTRTGDHRGLSR